MQYNFNSGLLPYSVKNANGYYYYSNSIGPELPPFLYIAEDGDYSGVKLTTPPWTSHFDPWSIDQVFRGSWSNDSDYLSFITFNKSVRSSRILSHDDQLSFEYYSHGDLLLADGGEDRNVLGSNSLWGSEEVQHNDIAIEDPRTPFTKSAWANSPARGIYKGNSYVDIKSPSYIKFIADTPWMQAVSAMVTMTQVPDGTLYSNQPQDAMSLSSPIAYERTILYPDNDYFLVVDRMEGTQPWIYRVIFRPSSLSITPTTSGSKIRYVNGALSIGGSSYNWLNIPYNSERYLT